MSLDTHLTTYIKVDSKWITNLSGRAKNYKTFRRKWRRKSLRAGYGLRYDPKHSPKKKKLIS